MALVNSDKWNDLHKDPKFWPEYPSERVVQWAFRELNVGDLVLDHGCGTGRHSIFLAENGFKPQGCDVSQNGLMIAKMRSDGHNYNIPFNHYDGVGLPYFDNTFDGLLSYGVLYYLPVGAIPLVIEELKRVLKPKGKAFIVIRSQDDSRYKKKIGRGDDDIEQVFFTKDLAYYHFRGWSKVVIDTISQTYGEVVDSDLLIYATK